MRHLVMLLAIGMLLTATTGCSNVQKGMAAGGAAGAGTGALYATYLSGAGTGVGALVGAGAGGLGGAIAAEHFYGEDEEAIEKALALEQKLQSEQNRTRGLEQRVDELESQRQKLLAELERTRVALNNRPVAQGADPAPQATVDTQKMELVVPFKSDVLFDPGKATLSSGGKKELHDAVKTIRKQFSDAQIEVRGHTDSTPIKHSGFRSNWHLSTARACEVVTYLIKHEGFSKDRLRPVGYADTQPVATNETAAGRAKNRRAEIVVRPGRAK